METVLCNLRRMLRRPLCLLLTLALALACRRGERDRGRLVAVELRGRLRRHDVPARSGCGRFALWRARSRPCAIVVHRHGGTYRQWDAARRYRQLGVPVEDHERVRPPADPPLSTLQPPSLAFKRPASNFMSLPCTLLAGSSGATPA